MLTSFSDQLSQKQKQKPKPNPENLKLQNPKPNPETLKAHREPRLARSKRHVRIADEEDFDVRLCQANRNGTICPPGIDQVSCLERE